MNEMEAILQRKAGELVTKQVPHLETKENHLLLDWKDHNTGMSITFNLTWVLRNTRDVKDILRIIQQCQKELSRRGLNHSS